MLMDSGYISGCKEMPYFIQTFGTLQSDGSYILTSGTNSLITSILSAGTFVGALSGSLVGDGLGRRWGLVFYMSRCPCDLINMEADDESSSSSVWHYRQDVPTLPDSLLVESLLD